jgi:AraC-like DNA-binding protein
VALIRDGRLVGFENNDYRIDRFSSDDLPERDRVAFTREVYGRVIVKHDIEPHPGSRFYWRSALRRLPGLGVASTICSGVHTERTPSQIDSDDLVINITVAGKRIVRQHGREAVVGPEQAALTRSRDVASCDCEPNSHLINLRIPVPALAPPITDLDRLLVRTIPAETEGLAMLTRYIEAMQREDSIDTLAGAQARGLAIAHVYDLIALILGAMHDAGSSALRRSTAARIRAIKADIIASSDLRAMTVEAVAARHHVSVRYVQKLFEAEGLTFSRFVLAQRLIRVHRMLTDPRFAAHTISSIAFSCGFGDLSYFNRAFRQQYGATPSDLRATVEIRRP